MKIINTRVTVGTGLYLLKRIPFDLFYGLVAILSLGHIQRPIADTKRYWQHWRRPRNFVQPGTYKNRIGATVVVRENVEGWLDGLPFVVSWAGTPDRPAYTVNKDGLVYPSFKSQNSGDLLPNT